MLRQRRSTSRRSSVSPAKIAVTSAPPAVTPSNLAAARRSVNPLWLTAASDGASLARRASTTADSAVVSAPHSSAV